MLRQLRPRQVGEGESPTGEDDDEPLRDDSEVNAERLNRRFARLTAARRKAERERDALSQQHQVELAQTRGQLEAVQRMLVRGRASHARGASSSPPARRKPNSSPAHEDYVLAAANYGAQQEFAARDQQTQQERQQSNSCASSRTS